MFCNAWRAVARTITDGTDVTAFLRARVRGEAANRHKPDRAVVIIRRVRRDITRTDESDCLMRARVRVRVWSERRPSLGNRHYSK